MRQWELDYLLCIQSVLSVDFSCSPFRLRCVAVYMEFAGSALRCVSIHFHSERFAENTSDVSARLCDDSIFFFVFRVLHKWVSIRCLLIRCGLIIFLCFRLQSPLTSEKIRISVTQKWWGLWLNVICEKNINVTRTPHTLRRNQLKRVSLKSNACTFNSHTSVGSFKFPRQTALMRPIRTLQIIAIYTSQRISALCVCRKRIFVVFPP